MKKNKYQRFLWPLLSRIDPESAHTLATSLLSWSQGNRGGRALLASVAGSIPSSPVRLFGLDFPNVLGVAAGFDKEGRVASGLALLGFGHIEVGTITPHPQIGNPRPRIFRLPLDKGLINRMGFPSSGKEIAALRLGQLPRHEFVLGVSLGKQKKTPLAEAVQDYLDVMRALYPYADYLAVNISSPNTPELRQLQGDKYLGELLGALVNENTSLASTHHTQKKPILVKIAPDLSANELDQMLKIILENKVDGVIATNTTTDHEGLKDGNRHETGGLSGAPLSERSNQLIAHIAKETNYQLPIIGVGGVFSAEDVRAKLDAGASLVQLYTAMVYKGPGIAGQILRELK